MYPSGLTAWRKIALRQFLMFLAVGLPVSDLTLSPIKSRIILVNGEKRGFGRKLIGFSRFHDECPMRLSYLLPNGRFSIFPGGGEDGHS